jgi:hypothetical protein
MERGTFERFATAAARSRVGAKPNQKHCDGGGRAATLIEWRDFKKQTSEGRARLTKKHLVYEIHGD